MHFHHSKWLHHMLRWPTAEFIKWPVHCILTNSGWYILLYCCILTNIKCEWHSCLLTNIQTEGGESCSAGWLPSSHQRNASTDRNFQKIVCFGSLVVWVTLISFRGSFCYSDSVHTYCFEINICMFDKIFYVQFSSKHLRVRPWRSRNPQKSSKRQNEARSRGKEAQRIRWWNARGGARLRFSRTIISVFG